MRNAVEFLFHLRGETVVQQVFKLLHQAVGHQFTDLLGVKAALDQAGIAPLLDRGDDGRVSGGTPDAAFLEFAHQARLAVTGSRFGEVLNALKILEHELFACAQVRQRRILPLLGSRRQNLRIPVELHHATANPQFEGTGLHQHRCTEVLCIGHLTGNELPPDQVVQARALCIDTGQVVRQRAHIGRPDRLVSLLGTVATRIEPRLGRHVGAAELVADVLAAGGHRLTAQVGGIGAHVGDVARLVKPLRRGHGALYRKTQARPGCLLQGRSDERRIRTRAGRAVVPGSDPENTVAQSPECRIGVRLVAGAKTRAILLYYLKAQHRIIAPPREIGKGLPVLFRRERADFPLPVNDQAHRHRLHPARRQPPRHLGPQQGRQFEADHPIEKAACLLGIDPVHVEFTRRLECRAYGVSGDFVEHHAPVTRRVAADGLAQVPGNGFAFPVEVRGQVHRISRGGVFRQFGDHLLLARQNLVSSRPSRVRVDPHAPNQLLAVLACAGGLPLLGGQLARRWRRPAPLGRVRRLAANRQVTHMTDAGLDDVVAAEVPVDGAGLGGRFNDDEGAGH